MVWEALLSMDLLSGILFIIFLNYYTEDYSSYGCLIFLYNIIKSLNNAMIDLFLILCNE